MKKILAEELIKPTSTANVNVGKVTSIDKMLFDDINRSATNSKVKITLGETSLSGMGVSITQFNPPNVQDFVNNLGYKDSTITPNAEKGYVWKKGQNDVVTFKVYNNTTGTKIDLKLLDSSGIPDADAQALSLMKRGLEKAAEAAGLTTESFNYEINRMKKIMNL